MRAVTTFDFGRDQHLLNWLAICVALSLPPLLMFVGLSNRHFESQAGAVGGTLFFLCPVIAGFNLARITSDGVLSFLWQGIVYSLVMSVVESILVVVGCTCALVNHPH